MPKMLDTKCAKLVALACISYRRGDFKGAGTLFSHALSEDDSNEFIADLLGHAVENVSHSSDIETAADLVALATESAFLESLSSDFESDDMMPISEMSSLDDLEDIEFGAEEEEQPRPVRSSASLIKLKM